MNFSTVEDLQYKQTNQAEEILKIIYRRIPILEKTYSAFQQERSIEDIIYHIEHLISAFSLNKVGLFKRYILWVRSVLETRGVSTKVLKVTLESMKEFYSGKTSLEFRKQLVKYLDEALSALETDYMKPSPFLTFSDDLGNIAKKYLKSLLIGDKNEAKDLIERAMEQGFPIIEIFDKVITPVQYEVGRLWQTNQISVAREHLATQVSKSILMELKYDLQQPLLEGGKIIITTIPKERHDFGVQMLAKLFELKGWNVFFLGPDTPIKDVIEMISKFEIDVLAISVGLIRHLFDLKQYINKIRNSKAKKVKIIVGGKAMNDFPNIWKKLGADDYSKSLNEALDKSKELL